MAFIDDIIAKHMKNANPDERVSFMINITNQGTDMVFTQYNTRRGEHTDEMRLIREEFYVQDGDSVSNPNWILHRLDGPAVRLKTEGSTKEYWYTRGIEKVSEEELSPIEIKERGHATGSEKDKAFNKNYKGRLLERYVKTGLSITFLDEELVPDLSTNKTKFWFTTLKITGVNKYGCKVDYSMTGRTSNKKNSHSLVAYRALRDINAPKYSFPSESN